MQDYGKKLLALRARLNISQEKMAEYFDVAFATINRWENGRAVPSKINMIQIDELCKKHKVKV